ncbi:MAG: hypothetical protein QOD44_2912 [Solirubrobacteraceae bacterium]|nr:hypothetical protein [Solirubrobacteraceae bacterium]
MRRGLVLCALLVALAGCGVGAGDAPKGAGTRLTVSRDFGAERMGASEQKAIPAGETVMRLLQRRFKVDTRYGGGFVQEIDGVGGGRRGGRPVDWFFYVNGIEADRGAAARRLAPGDRVWWDHHDWGAAMRVPAVVGSYPAPFVSSSKGKRVPVRIDCGAGAQRACREVQTRLQKAGAQVGGTSIIGQEASRGVLRVLVGRWSEVRRDPAARRIEGGPKLSGVYARPSATGDRIELLDARGSAVRTLAAGSGLVAATSFLDQQPTWFVAGTDDAGVGAAAAALDEARLNDHFAVAVSDNREVPLPVRGGTGSP